MDSSLPPPAPLAAGGIRSRLSPPTTQSLSLAAVIGVIAGLLGFAVCAIVLIRVLFRCCSRRASEAEAGVGASRSAAARRTQVEVVDDEVLAEARGRAESGRGQVEVVVDEELPAEARRAAEGRSHVEVDDELPVFTIATAVAAPPASSPDCAVCLAPLAPDDELRLLPACRHAFHGSCIAAWLRTNPICPLCRVAVPLPVATAAAAGAREGPLGSRTSSANSSTRSSFRVELGSVTPAGRRSSDRRTYSLGSFDYRVDEEVEAVVSHIVRPAAATAAAKPPTFCEALAEAAGSRGWLRQYFDRLIYSGQWSGRLSQDDHDHRRDDSWRWDPEAAAAVSTS